MLWSYKQEKQRFMKKSSFLEFLKASFKMCVCDVNVLRSFHRFKSRYVKKYWKKHMKMPMELITLFPTYSIAGHFRGSNIFAGLTKLLNGSVLNFTIWQYWYLCCTRFFSCPMLFFFRQRYKVSRNRDNVPRKLPALWYNSGPVWSLFILRYSYCIVVCNWVDEIMYI